MRGVALDKAGILGYSPPRVANRENTEHSPIWPSRGCGVRLGMVFRGFCLEWGIDFITFSLISRITFHNLITKQNLSIC